MNGTFRSVELGELLTQLKERSGYSYDQIGRRVNASRSSVHRYCTGLSVPHEFAMIERIARVCGARKGELDRLYGLWAAAFAARDRANFRDQPVLGDRVAPAPESSGPEDKPLAAAHAVPPSVPPSPAGEPIDSAPTVARSTAHRPRRMRAVLQLGVVVAWLIAATSIPGDLAFSRRENPSKTDGDGRQWVVGPEWTLPPERVSPRLFGVTINSGTGSMPTFKVGAVRLWDGATRWSEVQPGRDVYDWSTLDRHVTAADSAGLPVLFVIGGTPAWAAPNGARSVYPDGARAAPPDDLETWDRFVRGLAERYRGRIEAYELWVLANDDRFYSGRVETLIEMTNRASRIIRAVDRNATIVCPGMGNLWTDAGQAFLRTFARLGGYNNCDVAGIKMYQRSAADPPESMLELINDVYRIYHEVGVHLRLWNTGTTYSIALERPLSEIKARNYAVRFFLVGLYSREVNLERMYFYNWGGARIPIVLQVVGGSPTRAARAVEQLQHWLAHAESRSCGHGSSAELPENGWRCEFAVVEADARQSAAIVWTQTGEATLKTGSDVESISYLDGTTKPVKPGDALVISEEPILIKHRA